MPIIAGSFLLFAVECSEAPTALRIAAGLLSITWIGLAVLVTLNRTRAKYASK